MLLLTPAINVYPLLLCACCVWCTGDVEAQHVHNKQNFDFTLDLDTM